MLSFSVSQKWIVCSRATSLNRKLIVRNFSLNVCFVFVSVLKFVIVVKFSTHILSNVYTK